MIHTYDHVNVSYIHMVSSLFLGNVTLLMTPVDPVSDVTMSIKYKIEGS